MLTGFSALSSHTFMNRTPRNSTQASRKNQNLSLIHIFAGGGGLGTLTDTTAFFNSVEFASPEVGWAGIFAGASILCMSFLGFDSVTTIAEETIEPEKTIGRALLIVCFAAGGTFILTSYIMQSAWPEAWFSFNDADSGAYEYMGHVLGNVVALIFCAIFIICLLYTSRCV